MYIRSIIHVDVHLHIKFTISMQVNVFGWQKRYINVSLPNDFEILLKNATEFESQYQTALGKSCNHLPFIF